MLYLCVQIIGKNIILMSLLLFYYYHVVKIELIVSKYLMVYQMKIEGKNENSNTNVSEPYV